MKVNIVSRKLIKPCTPTPHNLRNYKISFIDELTPPMNVGTLFFYPSRPKQIIHLEESVAQVLAQFYPLAGRYLKKQCTVDCSDQGAEFVQAEAAAGVELSHVINTDQLDHLLPRKSSQVDKATDPLLSIQVTGFECGGLVIGVSLSHRVFDGSSIGTFIAAWSNASKHPGGKVEITPSFDSVSVFPGRKLSRYSRQRDAATAGIVVRRFLFKKEAIESVRSNLRRASRVRVVCALIAKALIRVHRARCRMVQSVNMRHRTIPPLPKHSCGNLVMHAVAEAGTDSGIQDIVYLLSDAIEETASVCAEASSLKCDKIIIDHEAKLIPSGEVRDLWFTDWSKFGFYEADFGWGKPVWAGVGALPLENLTVLMNSKEGDGIEAWVHLNKKDIACLDQDIDIKLFTI